MKIIPLRFTLGLASAALLCSPAIGQSVINGTFFLPQPAGASPIAGWLPTNVVIDDEGFNADGAWSSAPNGTHASYTNGSGNFVYNTSLTSNFMGSGSVYSMDESSTHSLSTTDYSGAPFSKLILQLVVNYSGDADIRDSQDTLNASLIIGGTTFTSLDATFFDSDRNYQPSGFDADPNNRYWGHYGGLSLITYEWDLDELGFNGDNDAFSFNWEMPIAHSMFYDVQISAVAVPEPATYALMIGGGLSLYILLRRRNTRHA